MSKEKGKTREEEIKLKIADKFFKDFDCTNVEGDIDFTVADKAIQGNLLTNNEVEYYLWAEAKRPNQKDIYKLFVQLILTIGKSEYLKNLIPPKYLGAFTSEKLGFIEYSAIHDIFFQNDFDWTVKPSNYRTKEFKQLYELIKTLLTKDKQPNVFYFDKDEKELNKFIKSNFKKGKNHGFVQIEVTKNNFVHVYRKWLEEVKNTIDINWEIAKKGNILDVDFFIADLFSENNSTIKGDLNAILKGDCYEFNRQQSSGLGVNALIVHFKDNQVAHTNFWFKYKRPPKNKFQDYILKRKDLLVPQDIREIKGAYFTPQVWVQKSQEYLTNYFGENWQDEYYIWDCCAGTGNMENGLTNKYHIWASTLDKSDVDIMKDRIKNGANLLESHVFQFDFLNDNFEDKCPKELLEILKDEEKRKKLIIYINPPYKETTSSKSISNKGSKHKSNVALSMIKTKYQYILKQGAKELFIQFLTRCYFEIQGAYIANFSTIKALQGLHFKEFRDVFEAKLEKMFIVPASTFDNVTGKFPIGFFIWNTLEKWKFKSVITDVYNADNEFIFTKEIKVTPDLTIKDWLRKYNDKQNPIAYLVRGSSDVQNNNIVHITLSPSKSVLAASNANYITQNNLIPNCIFLSIRKVIQDSWINDRDQYLYPNELWVLDEIFQTNCLVYSLFNNDIKSSEGKNNWIPYTEQDVDAKNCFESHFMTDYIKENNIEFSEEAKQVLNAGKELYKYYHSKDDSNPNASFYDIRMYFQGLNDKGKMNSRSSDDTYTELLQNLRQDIKKLEGKIIPKIYEYGFLSK